MRVGPAQGLAEVSQIELDRRAFRRKQTVRSTVISCLSLAVFVGLIALVLANSEGWERVRAAFFDPDVFVASIPEVFVGLLKNIQILFFAVIGVSLLSTGIALVRTTRSPLLFPLRFLAAAL